VKWFAPYALLPTGAARDVLLEEDAGRFTEVRAGVEPGNATRLPGIVLPGFANCHSHAFHRALRGRTHDGGGTFWTWRQRMYAVADRLDPDTYLALARATYAEMALAGITSVGEFHYLHHGAGGRAYDDPNAMAAALAEAAAAAGIRLTLLDTCYLAAGMSGEALDPTQRRFSDGTAAAWAARFGVLHDTDRMRIGAAIHSVRAVPRDQMATVVGAAGDRPLHVHLSEQPAENEACLARYGCTPTQLLAAEGALGTTTTAVHATHLSSTDAELLGSARVTACICPTTERDLADGIGPTSQLRAEGAALSLGSDQNAVIDMFEEARGLEMDERLASLRRGNFGPEQLLATMTAHESLGWADAGRLEAGARADLVAVRLDTVRTAGIDPAQVVLAATAADVDTVVVDGRAVVAGGVHRLGDVAQLLSSALRPVLSSI
jgi:formiminoglutamate deiminase